MQGKQAWGQQYFNNIININITKLAKCSDISSSKICRDVVK